MFLTMLHTGVRSGECAGLQWGDLDFNSKFVIVRRTVTPSGRIENTKTDRVRRVDNFPLTKHAALFRDRGLSGLGEILTSN